MNIKANELSVGNWVMWIGKPCQVDTGILVTEFPFKVDSSKYVKPIRITEEFLKSNGFVFDDDINEIIEEKYYLLKLDKFTITIHEGGNTLGRDWWVHIDNEDCCTIASADVQYVHQLQNLFNIANVEIDIRL
jgi:hypothetical protein